jgi:hypothetical protein
MVEKWILERKWHLFVLSIESEAAERVAELMIPVLQLQETVATHSGVIIGTRLFNT